MHIILASASPRRRQLMALVTTNFLVHAANVTEESAAGATPLSMVQSLAQKKAAAVFARHGQGAVIGCDTTVELAGKALGKPENVQAARGMLQMLAGQRHLVHTGICIVLPGAACGKARQIIFVQSTAVHMAHIPNTALEAYLQTREPYDKAGGYAIQGWAAKYICQIEGCYYNVMGLPVAALYRQLLLCGALHI